MAPCTSTSPSPSTKLNSTPAWWRCLPTPAAVVDTTRLAANCQRMRARADSFQVHLRPHVKSHKTLEGARRQLGGKQGGIAVSTLAEARFFAAAGFTDITYAVPIAPARLPNVLELARLVPRFTILVDHPEVAAAAGAAAAAAGVHLGVLLEVDCGAHRCGVNPTHPASVELAAQLATHPHLDFRGLLTHAGHAYSCRNAAEAAQVAAQERQVTVDFAQRLHRANIPVREVSIGSTPTVCAAEDLRGVTEVRPGNYVFFDAFQAAIGSCTLAECAFTVLTTVIGCYPERGTLVLDAGALALSRDPGPTHVHPSCGYGVLCTPADLRPIPGLTLVSLTQEHGTVRATSPAQVTAFPPGWRLRIIPNHACLAAACFDTYHVLRDGHLEDTWHPCRGW